MYFCFSFVYIYIQDKIFIFTKEFTTRMQFLEDFRKRRGVRDYLEHPSTLSRKEIEEQVIRHWNSKMNLEKNKKNYKLKSVKGTDVK